MTEKLICVGGIPSYITIKLKKKGGHVYREEYRSIRQGRRVISKFVRYIGPEGGKRRRDSGPGPTIERIEHGASSSAGAVRLLWSVAEDLRIRGTIDEMCRADSHDGGPTPGQLLAVWAINRVLDPESATQLEHWVPVTDLPVVSGVSPEEFTKPAFLRSLDRIVRNEPAIGSIIDRTAALDDALYQHWRKSHPLPEGAVETLAYDLTPVLFFGVTCPLAELGYNPDGINRLQVNVALAVSRHDHAPVLHSLYSGDRHGAGTVRNLLVKLDRMKVPKGMLIWDRGLTSKDHVTESRALGWHVLGGLPRTLKAVKALLDTVDVPETPRTLAASTRVGSVYAVKLRARVYGQEFPVIVYRNTERAMRDRNERNEALSKIGEALDALAREGKGADEAKLHERIAGIVGPWGAYVRARVSRKGEPRVAWEFRTRSIEAASRRDGKVVLLCTDDRLSAKEAVQSYLSKDFVEKVFRTLKSDVEVEPVRHRLEHRVRAFLAVCMLALRLQAALLWRIKEAGVKDNAAEYMDRLLRELSRVERVEVRFGATIKTWYLNMTDFVREALKKIGKEDLLKEESRLAPAV